MQLGRYITEATQEVFATMIFMDLEPGETRENEKPNIDANLSSMIGLAGDLRGIISVLCPAAVAQGITGAMLGMDVTELDEDVKDAIGEIANMVAGGLKEAIAGDKKNIELAIPTTVIGKGIRTSGLKGATSVWVPFVTPMGEFGIEIKYVLS